MYMNLKLVVNLECTFLLRNKYSHKNSSYGYWYKIFVKDYICRVFRKCEKAFIGTVITVSTFCMPRSSSHCISEADNWLQLVSEENKAHPRKIEQHYNFSELVQLEKILPRNKMFKRDLRWRNSMLINKVVWSLRGPNC